MNKLTDKDIIYASDMRCRCGAGVAYPIDQKAAAELGAWACSAQLKEGAPGAEGHDLYPFAFWSIREEGSIRLDSERTTRPMGTVLRTVGTAVCPACSTTWKSEPYVACGKSHHWFPGPCPSCGFAVGASGRWDSKDGKPIDVRYMSVVLSP